MAVFYFSAQLVVNIYSQLLSAQAVVTGNIPHRGMLKMFTSSPWRLGSWLRRSRWWGRTPPSPSLRPSCPRCNAWSWCCTSRCPCPPVRRWRSPARWSPRFPVHQAINQSIVRPWENVNIRCATKVDYSRSQETTLIASIPCTSLNRMELTSQEKANKTCVKSRTSIEITSTLIVSVP